MHLIYTQDNQKQNFPKSEFIRFGNVINNTTIISTFNIDNTNITNIKTQHQQIMTVFTIRFLKFKLSIVASYTFFAVVTFNIISSFTQNHFIVVYLL